MNSMLGFTAVAMIGKRIGLPQQPTALPGFEEFDDGPTEPTSSDVESDGRLKLHRPPTGNWQETSRLRHGDQKMRDA